MTKNPFLTKIVAGIVIACAVILFIWQASADHSSPVSETNAVTDAPALVSSSSMTARVIQVAGRSITVSIADTQSTRKRGLSGRTGLGPDEGMLFIFPEDDWYAFWMKDMRFAIDIVWLSSDGTVITIAPSVSPKTYPHSFIPSAPARYVVELPAGFAREYNLKMGDKVQL